MLAPFLRTLDEGAERYQPKAFNIKAWLLDTVMIRHYSCMILSIEFVLLLSCKLVGPKFTSL